MRRWTVGTTALCIVAIEVEAETEEQALRKAAEAPGRDWEIGEIQGEVDLEEGTYEVTPVEDRR